MTRTDDRQALAQYEWFRGLPADVVAQLASLAVRRRFGNGERIHAKGDAPDGLYGLLEGQVRISHLAADGRELLVTLFEPGHWWGEISMFDGLPRTHDASAVGDCEVLLLPQQRFQSLLRENPELYPHFVKMLCAKLRLALSYIEDATFLPLSARLAKRLLELARLYGRETEDGVRLDVRLPQGDLARMLGASRQSVSKELKAMEKRGALALDYGRVTLRNAAVLEKIAQGSPAR